MTVPRGTRHPRVRNAPGSEIDLQGSSHFLNPRASPHVHHSGRAAKRSCLASVIVEPSNTIRAKETCSSFLPPKPLGKKGGLTLTPLVFTSRHQQLHVFELIRLLIS